jgi:hypothetical protein
MHSEAEGQAWIETWAGHIQALGLATVALPLIEIARAFGFVGSQALLLAQPLISGVVSETTLEHTMTLLDSPELLERLRVCLEGERR